MSAIEQIPTEAAQRSAARHRTFAWVVLLASFAVFCAMVFGLVQLVGFFYSSSTVSSTASVTLDTGSDMAVRPFGQVNFQAYSANGNNTVKAELNEGDTVRTGIDTQATVSFPDGSIVHLFPNTLITINQIKANRFTKDNVSTIITQEPYVRPGTQQASFIIAAMPSAPAGGYRRSELRINTCISQLGTCDSALARIELSPNSRVRVSIDTDRNAYTPVYYSRAAVLQGTVTMQSQQDAAPSVRLDLYQMGTIGLGGKGRPTVAAASDELIADGNFVREEVGPVPQDGFWGPPLPNQGSDAGNINGQVSITDTLVYTQQMHAANFYRTRESLGLQAPLTDYASIAIGQRVNIDLAPYIPGGTIRLAADVKLRKQSVLGGGVGNVEYPLIFKLVYQNSNDASEPSWEYGYYFVPDPNRPPVPLERGKQIKGDDWVHVEIPNLLTIDQLKGMRRIVRLDIYAAGHEFDSLVTNISLSAR